MSHILKKAYVSTVNLGYLETILLKLFPDNLDKNFSAYYEAAEFCWSIAHGSLQHLRPRPLGNGNEEKIIPRKKIIFLDCSETCITSMEKRFISNSAVPDI